MTVAETRQHGPRDTANGHEKVTPTTPYPSPLPAVLLDLVLVAAAVVAAVLAVTGVQQSTLLRPLAVTIITVVALVTGVRAIRRRRRSLLDPEADRKRPVLGEAVLVRAVTAGGGCDPVRRRGQRGHGGGGGRRRDRPRRVRRAGVGGAPALASAGAGGGPPARGPPLPALPAMDHLAVGGSLAATVLGAVLGVAGVSPVWWLVLAAWAVFPVASIAYVGAQRWQRAKQLRRVIPLAMQRYAPELVLFTARPDDAGYQVAMWLPYLRATGRRFVVLTRDELPALALAPLLGTGADAVPVVSCRRAADLEGCLPDTVRAVFYVNASSGNGAMVRYPHLRHVYLGHGDSDKPPSYNPTHAMFDTIFAAGPAAVRRYVEHGVRIDPSKFVVTGRPQVGDVAPAARPIAGVADPVVLYAPTWRGHVSETALSSLPRAERIVTALLARGATVVFRPHPFSHDFPADEAVVRRVSALLAADAKKSGRATSGVRRPRPTGRCSTA